MIRPMITTRATPPIVPPTIAPTLVFFDWSIRGVKPSVGEPSRGMLKILGLILAKRSDRIQQNYSQVYSADEAGTNKILRVGRVDKAFDGALACPILQWNDKLFGGHDESL